MPLLELWSSNPATIGQFSIEQIVKTAGSGNLQDGSDCANELHAYLLEVSSDKLAEYIDTCLTAHFPNSGRVLQDLVNELGRRLDYKVSNGRYQGTVNTIGYDGIWVSPEGHSIVVEVKTTDAYGVPREAPEGRRTTATCFGVDRCGTRGHWRTRSAGSRFATCMGYAADKHGRANQARSVKRRSRGTRNGPKDTELALADGIHPARSNGGRHVHHSKGR